MKKTVIILGSSRSFGHTRQLCEQITELCNASLIDLVEQDIGHFEYDFKNESDDFVALMKRIVSDYDNIIFATPVYWYSMSGRLKVFFDRLSDLLMIHKDLGRMLRGKNMAVLSCGSGGELNDGFYMPFKETAKYLGMHYLGDMHGWIHNQNMSDEVEQRTIKFAELLLQESS